MNRFDRFFSRAVLGALPPVLLLLVLWWSAIGWAGDRGSVYFGLMAAGMAVGIYWM